MDMEKKVSKCFWKTPLRHQVPDPEEDDGKMEPSKVEAARALVKSLEKELQAQQDFAKSKVVEFQQTRKALLIQQVELTQLQKKMQEDKLERGKKHLTNVDFPRWILSE